MRLPPKAAPAPADAPAPRLLLDSEDWGPTDSPTGAVAKLLVPENGSAIRPIIAGTRKHATGAYPSFKTRRTQYWEGVAERALIHEAETYPQIVCYQMNGYTLEFPFNGKTVRYTPDQVREYADGYIEFIEAKSSQRGFSDDGYNRMLLHVEAILAARGRGFRRVTGHEIFVSALHRDNVGITQSRRFVTVKPDHLDVLEKLRAANAFVVACGELARHFEPDQPLYGMAVVQALMVRRHLHIDLKSPLGADTAVWILPEPTTSTQTTMEI